MEREVRFNHGDEIIRETLARLAVEHGVRYRRVDLSEPRPGFYVYNLLGTEKSVALRRREIYYAADPETLARYVTPRLRAMFKELWWEQALVLMGLR